MNIITKRAVASVTAVGIAMSAAILGAATAHANEQLRPPGQPNTITTTITGHSASDESLNANNTNSTNNADSSADQANTATETTTETATETATETTTKTTTKTAPSTDTNNTNNPIRTQGTAVPDAKGSLNIMGIDRTKRTILGYRLATVRNIGYGIDPATNAYVATDFRVATEQRHIPTIESAMGAIVDNEASESADRAKTLLERYRSDAYFYGSGAPQSEPNPMGWMFEHYGDIHENYVLSNPETLKDDSANPSIMRRFANELSKRVPTTGDYTTDTASTEQLAGFHLLKDVSTWPDYGAPQEDGNHDLTAEVRAAPSLVSTTYRIPVGGKSVTIDRDAAGKKLGELYLKRCYPAISKEVAKPKSWSTPEDPQYESETSPDFAMGDTVPYRIVSLLPLYTGHSFDPNYGTPAAKAGLARTFIISDYASKGITVGEGAVSSIIVTRGNLKHVLVKGKDFDVRYGEKTAYPSLAKGAGNASAAGGNAEHDATKTVIDLGKYVNMAPGSQSAKDKEHGVLIAGNVQVIINAKLNGSALVSDQDSGSLRANKATAELTFSNNLDDMTSTHTSRCFDVDVYTYRFRLKKTDKAGKVIDQRDGAQFAVRFWGSRDTSDPKWLASFDEKTGWRYSDEEPTADSAGAWRGDAGIFTLNGVDAGTYTIVEIKAPKGYSDAFLPTFSFDMRSEMETTRTGDVFSLQGSRRLRTIVFDKPFGSDANYVTDSSNVALPDGSHIWQFTMFNVRNLAELPLTGGTGLMLLLAVGSVLVLIAVPLGWRAVRAHRRGRGPQGVRVSSL